MRIFLFFEQHEDNLYKKQNVSNDLDILRGSEQKILIEGTYATRKILG